jgi:hypothetical protein
MLAVLLPVCHPVVVSHNLNPVVMEDRLFMAVTVVTEISVAQHHSD